MAVSRMYRCNSCGLSGRVSGGDDRGFSFSTQTRYCPDCEKLMDVRTGEAKAPRVNDLGMFDPDIHPSDDRECPRCHGHRMLAWSVGQPCPRCNGEIEDAREGEVSGD